MFYIWITITELSVLFLQIYDSFTSSLPCISLTQVFQNGQSPVVLHITEVAKQTCHSWVAVTPLIKYVIRGTTARSLESQLTIADVFRWVAKLTSCTNVDNQLITHWIVTENVENAPCHPPHFQYLWKYYLWPCIHLLHKRNPCITRNTIWFLRSVRQYKTQKITFIMRKY